jgi:hypothetical protein
MEQNAFAFSQALLQMNFLIFIKYFKTLSVNHPRLVSLAQKRAILLLHPRHLPTTMTTRGEEPHVAASCRMSTPHAIAPPPLPQDVFRLWLAILKDCSADDIHHA